MRSRVRAWILPLLLAYISVGFASAQGPKFEADKDLESLVLELKLKSLVLSSDLPALYADDMLYLPFSRFCHLIGVEPEYSPIGGKATIAQPPRVFEFSPQQKKAWLNGKQLIIRPGSILASGDELYVESKVLERWLGATFTFRYSRMELSVTSLTPLPIELKKVSEARREALLARPSTRQDLPLHAAPYKAFSPPIADISLSGSNLGETGAFLPDRYSVVATGDLLHLTARWFLTGDSDDWFRTARLQMGRTSLEQDLLGPLRARSFAFGDVISYSSPLIANSKPGRGFTISTFPATRTGEFSRTTLTGESLPDWEVELYRNEVLIDYQRAGSDGRYFFADVPLVFGINDFKIVSYGPQGQRREERKSTYIGAGMSAPGERNYRISAVQERTPFLVDRSMAGQAQGRLRWLAEYEQGLSQSTSVSARVGGAPIKNQDHVYAAVGLRRSVDGAFTRFDLVADARGGWGIAAGVQTAYRGMNVAVELARYFDRFVSERAGVDLRPLAWESRVRVDGSWSPVPGIPIAYTVSLQHLRDAITGRPSTSVAARFATSLGGVLYSNAFTGGQRFEADRTAQGVLSARRRAGAVAYQAQVGYGLTEGPLLQSLGLSVQWRRSKDLRASFGIHHDLLLDQTTLQASLNREAGGLAWALTLSSTLQGQLGLALVMSTSLAQDPREGYWIANSQAKSSGGALSARVFIDNNLSGTYDEGDELLSGVRLMAGRRRLVGTTNAKGVVLVPDVPSGLPFDLTVDPTTLEDPYMVPLTQHVACVSREGATLVLDIPMVRLAEIEGTVSALSDAKEAVVAGIKIELLNDRGEIVARAETAYDGMYVFTAVLPGSYLIRVNPAQAESLRLSTGIKSIRIKNDGSVVNGVDITLKPLDPSK